MDSVLLLAPDRPVEDGGARAPPMPTSSIPSPPPAATPLRSGWLWPILRVLLIAAAGGGAWFIANGWERWTGASRLQRTDDAFLAGDLTPLSAKVSGYIANVSVQDFATVKRGEILALIEPSDYRAQLAQAEANRGVATATLVNIGNQKAIQRAVIRQAAAAVEATSADVTRSHLEANRQRLLLAGRLAGTPQAAERAEADEKRFAAQFILNKAALDQQRASLVSLDVQERALAAQRSAAEAQVRLAENNLRYTQIRSPADGMAGPRQVRPGQFVNVGTLIVAVMPLPDIWVIANYKETQMTVSGWVSLPS